METSQPRKDQLAQLVALSYSSGILYAEFMREAKKRYVIHVLQTNNGNQSKAARELGMHRNTLNRTIAELKLDPYEWNPRRLLSGHPPRTTAPGNHKPESTYAPYAHAKRRPERIGIIRQELAHQA